MQNVLYSAPNKSHPHGSSNGGQNSLQKCAQSRHTQTTTQPQEAKGEEEGAGKGKGKGKKGHKGKGSKGGGPTAGAGAPGLGQQQQPSQGIIGKADLNAIEMSREIAGISKTGKLII